MVRPRLGAALERRPILWSVALTVLWLVVMHLLGAVLVGGRDGAHLRAAAVNAGALAVPLAVVGLAGWWSRAGLAGPVLGRHWFVLAPLGLVAVSWLAFGVKAEPASVVLAGAVLQLTLGLDEEAMFRGLVQGLWARHPALTQCGAVALIFGLQHGANLSSVSRPRRPPRRSSRRRPLASPTPAPGCTSARSGRSPSCTG